MDIRSQIRGAWRVDRVLVGGVQEPKGEDDEHFLWFTDDVIITGNADAAWEMPFALEGTSFPARIGITRSDRLEPWVERALVTVKGDVLQLCSAGAGNHGRPDRFESSEANGWTLYVATRCAEPAPE